MARIFSASLYEKDTPQGEREVVAFLARTLADRDDVWIWHGPVVMEGYREHHPDVVLFAREVGLVVLEVKDYGMSSVVRLSDSGCELRGGQKRTSPYKQAREYTFKIRNQIESHRELCNAGGPDKGRGFVPLSSLAVFTRIARDEAYASPFGAYFQDHRGRTIHSDDLATSGRFAGPDGAAELLAFLTHQLAFKPRDLTAPQRQVLHEEVLGGLPEMKALTSAPPAAAAPPAVTAPRLTMRVEASGGGRRPMRVALGKKALRFASELDDQPRLIRGVAGCGKTLFLVKHAELKATCCTPPRRILYTCYNLPLTAYVRALLDANLPAAKRDRVDVLSIYELAGRIAEEAVPHQGPTEKVEALERRALEKALRGDVPFARYDTLLIDEGQDFSPDLLRLALSTLAEGSRDVKIAEDGLQNLYGKRPRGFSYRSLGLDVTGGRARNNLRSYRCTQPIFDFACELMGTDADDEDEDDGLFNSDYGGRDGEPPVHRQMPSMEALLRFVADDVGQQLAAGRPAGEIGVLYVSRLLVGEPPPRESKKSAKSFTDFGTKQMAGDTALFVERLRERLTVPVEWFTRDADAKLTLDMGTAAVKIGSAYSSKGLDFECVYLLDLTGETFPLGQASRGESERTRHHRRLLYVGATRAKERLAFLQLTT